MDDSIADHYINFAVIWLGRVELATRFDKIPPRSVRFEVVWIGMRYGMVG
jgi:hypothetical protein